MKKHDEILEVREALAAWFKSQEVDPAEAIQVMAPMIGGLMAWLSVNNDKAHLSDGLVIVERIIRAYSDVAWKEFHKN